MSLFKIFKGKKENLASQTLHDGYAWYTKDDAGFYIDATNDENTVERKRINDAENTTLTSDKLENLGTVKEALEYLKEASGVQCEYNMDNESLEFTLYDVTYDGDDESLKIN